MSAQVEGTVVLPLITSEDVVRLRMLVRDQLLALGCTPIEQTKILTAASELARNTLRHGGGGEAHVFARNESARRGVTMRFLDDGPGIADVNLALASGFTTGGGMGLGLGGARRLADEFDIETDVGQGTIVTITKWKIF